MSPSKNNLTMINLIFLLGISLPQVSAGMFAGLAAVGPAILDVAHQNACPDFSNQCCTVAVAWKAFGGKTNIVPEHRTACCMKLGDTLQYSGIPGVICTADGKVTELNWDKSLLHGSIPNAIGYLADLEKL